MENRKLVLIVLVGAVLALSTFACGQPEFGHYGPWVQGMPAE
jgi:hypothetical protein